MFELFLEHGTSPEMLQFECKTLGQEKQLNTLQYLIGNFTTNSHKFADLLFKYGARLDAKYIVSYLQSIAADPTPCKDGVYDIHDITYTQKLIEIPFEMSPLQEIAKMTAVPGTNALLLSMVQHCIDANHCKAETLLLTLGTIARQPFLKMGVKKALDTSPQKKSLNGIQIFSADARLYFHFENCSEQDSFLLSNKEARKKFLIGADLLIKKIQEIYAYLSVEEKQNIANNFGEYSREITKPYYKSQIVLSAQITYLMMPELTIDDCESILMLHIDRIEAYFRDDIQNHTNEIQESTLVLIDYISQKIEAMPLLFEDEKTLHKANMKLIVEAFLPALSLDQTMLKSAFCAARKNKSNTGTFFCVQRKAVAEAKAGDIDENEMRYR